MNTFHPFKLASNLALAIACLGAAGLAHADTDNSCASCALSNASRQIPEASGMVVAGSMVMLAGSGLVVVDSVQTAGEASVVVLKGVGNGVKASVRVTADLGKQLSNAVGQSVQVVAVSTGNLLVMSGKAVAFIPNELGTALLHQNKLD